MAPKAKAGKSGASSSLAPMDSEGKGVDAAVLSAELQPGRRCLLWYRTENLWQERMVLAPAHEDGC